MLHGALQPLSRWNRHPGNLEELRHRSDLKGKPWEQGRSISLLRPAVKILERLILPSIVEALGTRPSQLDFKLRHSTALALLPISARVVSGFNQRKPPSRTITIAVDISKAFYTISSSRWSTAPDLATTWLDGSWSTSAAGRRRALTNSTIAFPPGAGGVPSSLQPSSTILTLTKFVEADMTSYANDFTILASALRIVEAEARATNYALYWWGGQMASNWPLLPRNPAWPCSLPTPTSEDSTLKCESVTLWLCWTEPPKILGVTLNTQVLHLRPSRPRLCRAGFEGPQCHKTLSWVELGLHDRNTVGHLAIRPSCATFSTTPPPSGSPKYPQHTWTSLSWSKTRPWGSRPDATKTLWRHTSGRRLGFSLWGRS